MEQFGFQYPIFFWGNGWKWNNLGLHTSSWGALKDKAMYESASTLGTTKLGTGWWFGTFFHILGTIITPFDFHIFQRGRSTTNQDSSR